MVRFNVLRGLIRERLQGSCAAVIGFILGDLGLRFWGVYRGKLR